MIDIDANTSYNMHMNNTHDNEYMNNANNQTIIAKCRIVKINDEYIVRAYDANNKRMSSCDYFTNDRDDARDTMRMMLQNSIK